MNKTWFMRQPGKFWLLLGIALAIWSGYPSQSGAGSAGKAQTVVFSDPIILLEVENSSGQELPVNQFGTMEAAGKLSRNWKSGTLAYHDFGSSVDDRVRVYAANGVLRFGSPADPPNTVQLDMTRISHIYALQSNTGMYVYVVVGWGGSSIAVIGKSKNGSFTAYTNADTWKKFYPADQGVLEAYYADRKRVFPTDVSRIEPHSPVVDRGRYTVTVRQDVIAIVGTIKSTSDLRTLSKWQYLLKWNGEAGSFDIAYQRMQ